MTGPKPLRLGVWKFSSCDGCQLTILNCEDELLRLDRLVDFVMFAEASSDLGDGPFDVSLVEGSVSTAADIERIQRVRDASAIVVAIGACATSGGVQAFRNRRPLDVIVEQVYPRPDWIDALPASSPIADYIDVDLELRGCPIDRSQLLELIASLLADRPARLPTTSVCSECKALGRTCVLVAGGQPCLGPVTSAGCGALCPTYNRGCYGCFGPSESGDHKRRSHYA